MQLTNRRLEPFCDEKSRFSKRAGDNRTRERQGVVQMELGAVQKQQSFFPESGGGGVVLR
jgi:hypothetical protein